MCGVLWYALCSLWCGHVLDSTLLVMTSCTHVYMCTVCVHDHVTGTALRVVQGVQNLVSRHLNMHATLTGAVTVNETTSSYCCGAAAGTDNATSAYVVPTQCPSDGEDPPPSS